jgi:hypothetical protein
LFDMKQCEIAKKKIIEMLKFRGIYW